ncbi:MAG: hypothetical protein EBR09_15240 [Proteobacteria bacterium]|nr:hypothetical protein [Pseudomonadota bacterium]
MHQRGLVDLLDVEARLKDDVEHEALRAAGVLRERNTQGFALRAAADGDERGRIRIAVDVQRRDQRLELVARFVPAVRVAGGAFGVLGVVGVGGKALRVGIEKEDAVQACHCSPVRLRARRREVAGLDVAMLLAESGLVVDSGCDVGLQRATRAESKFFWVEQRDKKTR